MAARGAARAPVARGLLCDADPLEQRGHASGHLLRLLAEQLRRVVQGGQPARDQLVCSRPGDRLDPSQPGADARLRGDPEVADLSGRGHVRTAAQLPAVPVDRHDAHRLGYVLLTEEHVRAKRLRIGQAHLGWRHRRVASHLFVDSPFDLAKGFAGRGAGGREVEPEAVRAHPAPRLPGLLAEHVAQGTVQEVRRGVVARRSPARLGIHLGADRLANGQRAIEAPDVHDRVASPLGVLHLEPPVGADQRAAIAHLAAALRVEGAPVEDHQGRLLIAIPSADADDGDAIGLGLVRVADELAAQRGERLFHPERRLAGGPGSATLFSHGPLERVAVDRDPGLRRDLDGEVDREAEGVMQLERVVAPNDAARPRRDHQLRQALAAGLEGACELLLLRRHRVEDPVASAGQHWVGAAHQLHDDRARLAQEGAGDAHQPGVPHRAPDDPPQDIAGSLVRRLDALSDHEGHGARVVRDDLVAEPLALHGLRVVTDEGRQAGDDRLEEVRPVVAVDTLHDRGDALQAHPGVDAAEREGRQGAVCRAIRLHEDKVPDLEPARAILGMVRHALRPLAEVGTAIVVQLAARAARAGVPHAARSCARRRCAMLPQRAIRSAGSPISSVQMRYASSSSV